MIKLCNERMLEPINKHLACEYGQDRLVEVRRQEMSEGLCDRTDGRYGPKDIVGACMTKAFREEKTPSKVKVRSNQFNEVPKSNYKKHKRESEALYYV
jgi:hypothetical protein